jgi:hypothetical protein
VRKRLSTALLAAMLAGASLEAPFAHVHPADPDHHHAQGMAHAHLAVLHHHDEAPEISSRDDDERAVYLDWAPTAAPRVAFAYAEAPPTLTIEPMMTSAGAAPEFRPRAHSPPATRLLPARAPPV